MTIRACSIASRSLGLYGAFVKDCDGSVPWSDHGLRRMRAVGESDFVVAADAPGFSCSGDDCRGVSENRGKSPVAGNE